MSGVLSNAAYTLVDLAARGAPPGVRTPDMVLVDMLSQKNAFIEDMPWMQANMGMKHRSSQVRSLPSGEFRMYNQGFLTAKGTTALVDDTCAMLEISSQIDFDLYKLSGSSDDWRLTQEAMFVEGLNQQMQTAMIYSDESVNPASFTGLAPRYNTRDPAVKPSAANVLDAGGRGTSNSSIWICGLGPSSLHGIYPAGSVGGLQMNDITPRASGGDPAAVDDGSGTGRKIRMLSTHFKWDCGMALLDWRKTVRIANIDVTTLTTSNAPNLRNLIYVALQKLPATYSRTTSPVGDATKPVRPITGENYVIYMNRTVQTALGLQASNAPNAHLQLREYDGIVVETFLGIPIRNVDAILNTEGTV